MPLGCRIDALRDQPQEKVRQCRENHEPLSKFKAAIASLVIAANISGLLKLAQGKFKDAEAELRVAVRHSDPSVCPQIEGLRVLTLNNLACFAKK